MLCGPSVHPHGQPTIRGAAAAAAPPPVLPPLPPSLHPPRSEPPSSSPLPLLARCRPARGGTWEGPASAAPPPPRSRGSPRPECHLWRGLGGRPRRPLAWARAARWTQQGPSASAQPVPGRSEGSARPPRGGAPHPEDGPDTSCLVRRGRRLSSCPGTVCPPLALNTSRFRLGPWALAAAAREPDAAPSSGPRSSSPPCPEQSAPHPRPGRAGSGKHRQRGTRPPRSPTNGHPCSSGPCPRPAPSSAQTSSGARSSAGAGRQGTRPVSIRAGLQSGGPRSSAVHAGSPRRRLRTGRPEAPTLGLA
ncbi:basic proline-rich protein-like [Canis lupus familiaris]|uniref:basic proline-rich protein-like n=1 Tax=Canis lupus familiaris TaxID=9615 RepID=UPI0018F33DF1|nr:basic proline-rich protein-like [Canis lupus familiaris]